MAVADLIMRTKLAKLDGLPRKRAAEHGQRLARAVRTFRNAMLMTMVVALVARMAETSVADVTEEASMVGRSLYGAYSNTMSFRSSTSVLALVTILVVYSVLMEMFVLEPLKEDVEENLKPIVNALFSELTLLGFVGLFMFVVTKLQLFHGMSMRLFHEGDALSELFEAVHMVLFLVMVIFLASATLLLYYGQQSEKKWRDCNDTAVDEKEDIIKRYAVAIQHSMHPSQDVQDEMLFLSLRARFVYGDAVEKAAMGGEVERGEGGQTKKIGFDGIPRDFELNDYLAIIQGETTGEIIELPVSSWMFLECMMALFYLVYLVVSTFWFSIIFVAAAYALMLVNFIQLAHIMRNYVIASSIELMKKQKVIRRVRRRMTTKKAVRCLKLLRLMKKKVPKAGSGRKHGEAAKTAEEIYKDEHVLRKKRRELQELFDLFDKDKSGDISSAEMLELLQLLKMAEDETQARDMLAELDDDQSGTVEFQEFFNWMASNDQEEETEESIEEYIDGMFDMIDTDESGTITAEEFQTTLKNLGTDLTMEDIQCMIREVDENGDGDIDREEFKEMVIKNMEQV